MQRKNKVLREVCLSLFFSPSTEWQRNINTNCRALPPPGYMTEPPVKQEDKGSKQGRCSKGKKEKKLPKECVSIYQPSRRL
jgi:hypothetical protein